MFVAGAALGLLAVAVPHGAGVNTTAWALNSALGLPVGAALFVFGRKVPTWLLHGLLIGGAAMVALGMLFGNGGPTSVATSFFFVWVALYVSWFFSSRATVVHLVLDGALFALALLVEGAPAGPAVWLLVMGTAIVVAIVVALMHRELIRVATLDALTGLPTRHTLSDALAREIARATRNGAPLCLAIIDVDGLKAVNDLQGHHAGDAVLVEAARAWRTALRDSDVLVRFGGDEFVAVLPDCPPDVAHRLEQRVGLPETVSCSAGFAWWQVGEGSSDLLRRADIQLYEAKRKRRSPQPGTTATTSA
jgi:diguanylate cyclase (GGDEF)-like protein